MLDLNNLTSLGDIARGQAKVRPDKIAFHFEGRETSYGAFDDHTNRVANGLIALGLKPGTRVSYIGKNSDLYFEAVFGAAKAGIVMTPVNWRLAGPEMVYILNDARAEVLFVGAEFIELVGGLVPSLNSVHKIIDLESVGSAWPGFAAWRDAQDAKDPQTDIQSGDVALQLYTSGTTGNPKGAMLAHQSLMGLRRIAGQPSWNTWTADDVSLVAMPAFHIGGTGWGIAGLINGAKGVVAREFDPHKVLDFIEGFGITKIFMVPAAMQIVVRHPRAREVDYSSIKYILYGASPIPLDLLKECMEVFGCGFVQMYGMTETSGTIVALPPEDHVPEGSPRMRSAGKALPGVEVVILDEAGQVVAPGVVGEIASRSIANMTGYWNLAEATAKALNSQGWLRTGDAGYMDEDGYIYIHDRVKDMIISGGENIYPAEVENAIFGHPSIADVAVIGIPDDKWGEAVKACVVLKAGTTASPAELIAWSRERIAAFKCPKSIDFIEALPRNASGKILRRQLREPYWAAVGRRVN